MSPEDDRNCGWNRRVLQTGPGNMSPLTGLRIDSPGLRYKHAIPDGMGKQKGAVAQVDPEHATAERAGTAEAVDPERTTTESAVTAGSAGRARAAGVYAGGYRLVAAPGAGKPTTTRSPTTWAAPASWPGRAGSGAQAATARRRPPGFTR